LPGAGLAEDNVADSGGRLLRHHHRHVAPEPVQRAGGHLVQLHHAAALLAVGIVQAPLDLHPHHVAGDRHDGDLPVQHEIRPRRGVLHHRAESGKPRADLPRQGGIAVTGGAMHALEEHPRRPVRQAVGVALPPRRLDAGQQRGDVGGGRAGHALEQRRRRLGPGGGRDGLALGGALVLARRILHGEYRHDFPVMHFGAGHQAPVARAGRGGHRGHLLRLQRAGQRRGQGIAAGLRQQRRAGRRHGQPGRRRLRQPARGGAGVAGERARQVAAAGQQQKQQPGERPRKAHSRPGRSAGSAPAA
jgi:hypothetical protein